MRGAGELETREGDSGDGDSASGEGDSVLFLFSILFLNPEKNFPQRGHRRSLRLAAIITGIMWVWLVRLRQHGASDSTCSSVDAAATQRS